MDGFPEWVAECFRQRGASLDDAAVYPSPNWRESDTLFIQLGDRSTEMVVGDLDAFWVLSTKGMDIARQVAHLPIVNVGNSLGFRMPLEMADELCLARYRSFSDGQGIWILDEDWRHADPKQQNKEQEEGEQWNWV